MGHDLKLAARRLLATPLFTIFAVLSLAVGVGVTTAVYSVVHSLFLKDLGIRDPDQVAFVVMPGEGRFLRGSISHPDFQDLRAAQTSFTRISAAASIAPSLATSSTTEVVPAEAVDGDYFSTLGVTTVVGRTIQLDDDVTGARVAVLSHGMWRARFAADPAVVGRTVRISGQTFEVIGVAAPGFEGASGALPFTRLWIPLGAEASLAAQSQIAPRDRRRLLVFGRLMPTVSAERASAELRAIAAGLDSAFPPRITATNIGPSQRTWSAKSITTILEEDEWLRRFGWMLVALVGLVLVVACTNLANLVLARGITRQRDLAVRLALGASRWRVVREQCSESLLLAIGGAVASFVIFQSLRAAMTTEFSIGLPFGGRWTLVIEPTLDMTALSMAAGSLLISLVVFGLEPALQLTRSLDVRGALAEGSLGGKPRARRQRLLLRWQVAISAGFFIMATMFVRYTIAEARHDPGVEMDRLGVAVLNINTQEWDEARVRRTLDRVLEAGQQDSSVAAISVSTGLPFGTRLMPLTFSMPDRPIAEGNVRPAALGIAATPGLFRTLGVEIQRGRGFDDRDHVASEPVAVLSEFTARQMFGTVDAVGRQLVVGDRSSQPVVTRVIGVARDTDVGRILSPPRPFIYLSLAQRSPPTVTIAVLSVESDVRAVRALREAIRAADPDLAVEQIGTGREILAGPFVFLRAAGIAAIGLGALTLLLAMVGLFGIQSHIVAYRTREIGVRMSFGATASQIRRMVLKDGYRPVLDGLAIGVVIGLAGRVIVRAYLDVDVSVLDPWMLLVVPIPLILAASLACYLPARRAAAVDPNVALRHE